MLLLVLATGAMDAACLLHLGVFTAYITASLILAGANLVDSPGSPWPGLVAVAGFIVGAIVAEWLTRRAGGRHQVVERVLLVEAASDRRGCGGRGVAGDRDEFVEVRRHRAVGDGDGVPDRRHPIRARARDPDRGRHASRPSGWWWGSPASTGTAPRSSDEWAWSRRSCWARCSERDFHAGNPGLRGPRSPSSWLSWACSPAAGSRRPEQCSGRGHPLNRPSDDSRCPTGSRKQDASEVT